MRGGGSVRFDAVRTTTAAKCHFRNQRLHSLYLRTPLTTLDCDFFSLPLSKDEPALQR